MFIRRSTTHLKASRYSVLVELLLFDVPQLGQEEIDQILEGHELSDHSAETLIASGEPPGLFRGVCLEIFHGGEK